MRTFLKIVLWGTLAFIAVAVVQERGVFLAALGVGDSPPPPMSATEQDEVAETVRRFLTLMAHYYGSGGDRRFGERFPASTAVVEELQRDVAYLRHNHRVQVPSLMGLEIAAVESRGEGRAVVRTREYWVVRTLVAGGGDEPESVESLVVGGSYALVRSGTEWQVAAWEVADLPVAQPPAPPPAGAAK